MADKLTITLTTVIQRNDIRFIANKLGDEMVMMNMDNGDFITLNNVGADIWSLSAEPIAVSELVNKLMGIYDISAERSAEETVNFLQNSLEQSMFTVHSTK